METQPQRKHPRLKEYDYSRNGCYFITVCTKGMQKLLSRIAVGRDDPGAPLVQLSDLGRIAEQYLLAIPAHYPNVGLDHYMIMPNHIHLLLRIGDGATGSSRPTVPRMIAAWKRFVSRDAGSSLFQASYHDHIIRDENDFLSHWTYIEGNPGKWAEDEYYTE